MRLDSQYGVCFSACMIALIKRVISDRKNHKLHVVIEAGHRNVRDCVRIFDEIKAEIEELGHHTLERSGREEIGLLASDDRRFPSACILPQRGLAPSISRSH
jgi:hypothetical protein